MEPGWAYWDLQFLNNYTITVKPTHLPTLTKTNTHIQDTNIQQAISLTMTLSASAPTFLLDSDVLSSIVPTSASKEWCNTICDKQRIHTPHTHCPSLPPDYSSGFQRCVCPYTQIVCGFWPHICLQSYDTTEIMHCIILPLMLHIFSNKS